MLGIGERHELPTVLLIDDDLVSREVIATVLTLHGHLVQTASDGAESIAFLDSNAFVPQVILMDTQMTGLSGLELIRELRQRSKAGIYVISGNEVPEDLLTASDGFLLKPFGPEALKKLLEERAPQPEVTASDPTEPVVNPETLAQFRQIMSESTVKEIYAAVVTDLKKRRGALNLAIAHGDSDEVRRIGHAIKGGCGMAGAMQAASLGAYLESNSDKLDNCASAVRDLSAATRKLESMLEAEFPA